ncbi:uncharacterized protein LOC117652875 [Thrips palmi]|uniref:Uncharacterized protein LOC117652875 n=1 Tax=Thrips palmi TaxID=161013 RepID=A0A6P9A7N2_THRPL|nr:uncharacterized protein LOC117652875 [Thrips palmi]
MSKVAVLFVSVAVLAAVLPSAVHSARSLEETKGVLLAVRAALLKATGNILDEKTLARKPDILTQCVGKLKQATDTQILSQCVERCKKKALDQTKASTTLRQTLIYFVDEGTTAPYTTEGLLRVADIIKCGTTFSPGKKN